METKVNDIDLQTDAAGAYGIENALTEWVPRKDRLSVSEKIASHWGESEIEGVKVEVMAALQKKRRTGPGKPPSDLQQLGEFVSFEAA